MHTISATAWVVDLALKNGTISQPSMAHAGVASPSRLAAALLHANFGDKLFPAFPCSFRLPAGVVVSASDDLHPISAEIEESAASKRTVKHSQSFKSPEWTHDREGAALLVHVASFRPETKTFGAVSEYLPVLPTKAPVIGTIGDRAPP